MPEILIPIQIVTIRQVYHDEPGSRVFSLVVEDRRQEDIDLLVIGGAKNRAFTIESLQVVDDGFVSIKSINIKDYAKLSAIEIHFKEIHTAHAVAQGPVSFALFEFRCKYNGSANLTFLLSLPPGLQYLVVDKDNDGFGVISVDSCTYRARS